jgi:hypothetical protein
LLSSTRGRQDSEPDTVGLFAPEAKQVTLADPGLALGENDPTLELLD